MSVVGPRPALWNQDVLISERDKYHANNVKPGLTGLAQINGRDKLEIPDKAKLDGILLMKTMKYWKNVLQTLLHIAAKWSKDSLRNFENFQ